MDATRQILRDIKLGKKIPALKNESEHKKIAYALEEAASWYFTKKNHQAPEIKKAMSKVQKTASDFHQCLKDLDIYTKYDYLKIDNYIFDSAIDLSEFVSGKAKEGNKKLEKESDKQKKETKKIIKSTAGRSKSTPAQELFISHIADTYEYITNRQPTVSRLNSKPIGPFFRFTQGCLKRVGENPNDEALYKSIRASLKGRRKYNIWGKHP